MAEIGSTFDGGRTCRVAGEAEWLTLMKALSQNQGNNRNSIAHQGLPSRLSCGSRGVAHAVRASTTRNRLSWDGQAQNAARTPSVITEKPLPKLAEVLLL